MAFAGEEGVPRDWPWVLQGLAHRRFGQGTGCPVDILETIIYCDGSPEALYYTSAGRVVSRAIAEDEGCITFAKAMAHLRPSKKYVGALADANSSGAEGGVGVNGAVAFTSTGEAIPVKTVDLGKIRKAQGTPPMGTVALVVLIPPKAPCVEPLLSIQHTFIVEPCTEAFSGARVLRLVLEVVEDVLGDLRLVRSSECVTTKSVPPYSRQRRSPSPSQSKTARLQSAQDIADELFLLRYGHAIGESAPCPPSELGMLATSPLGREDRREPRAESHRRAQTAMSPTEARGSQGTLDAEEWGFKTESPASTVRGTRRPQTESTERSSAEMASTFNTAQARGNRRDGGAGDVRDIGVTFQGFAAPGEHDPREIGRTVAAGRALGSSQLARMCHGDFCDTDLPDKIQQQARFELEESGNGSLNLAAPLHPHSSSGRTSADPNGSVGTSAFRTKILKLDEAALQDHGVLPADGGVVKGSHVTEQRSPRKGKGTADIARKGTGIDDTYRPGGGGGRLPRRSKSAVDKGKEAQAEWDEIPFSWIVRGRQESHLIDQQLRRYRRGNKEPFVDHLSSLGDSSVSLGAVFPATYYKPVRVCGNCYRVYSMVDEARTKSVKRLDAQAAAAAGEMGTELYADQGVNCSNGIRGQHQRAPKRARSGAETRRGEWVSRVQSNASREQAADAQIRGGSPSRGVCQPPDDIQTFSTAQGACLGKGIEEKGWERQNETSLSGESRALMRAQAAIDGLTRGDICELRSFAKPPAAVNMVTAALMIALTGQGEPTAAGWLSARRYMTNIDKLFTAISGLNLNTLRVSQTRKLETYTRNPAFRPEIVACVSLPASKICAWVLGVLEAHRWRTGRGHSRSSTLTQGPGLEANTSNGGRHRQKHSLPSSIPPFPSASSVAQAQPSNTPLFLARDRHSLPNGTTDGDVASTRRWTSSTTPSRVTVALGPTVYPFPAPGTAATTATAAAAANDSSTGTHQCSKGHLVGGRGGETRPNTTVGFNPRSLPQPALPQQAWIPGGVGPGCGSAATIVIGSPSRAGTAPGSGLRNTGNKSTAAAVGRNGSSRHPAPGSGVGGGRGQTTRAGRAAAKRRQDRVGERLANATAAAPDPAGFERSEFLCADGVTLMPYAVIGTGAPLLSVPTLGGTEGGRGEQNGGGGGEKDWGPGQEGGVANGGVLSFVVVHDFFDTLEKTFLLFKPLVLKYPGCQVLCFNSPGQAGTRLPPEPEGLLTNVWVADRLDELMQHVDNMGEMPLSDRPFHLLGIGNGASIATAFACHHASKNKWKPTLRSLACVNGFATVDAQLAAVLHSAQRAFECFPPERPDLPISFWSRFVFSEGYLKSIGSDLALNILCAVANPLGVEGMLRIVRGALRSRDLTKDLKTMALPLVLVQSTDNVLINAANVDPFLEGRRPRHVWSHQLRLGGASAANNSGNVAGNRGENAVSCIGSGGELALFESLSAGAGGAFVAWVKGGHETRQECKRLVVDVLDLLAAPGGQEASFFRRGAQVKRPSGSRVGIAAKGNRGAKAGAAVRTRSFVDGEARESGLDIVGGSSGENIMTREEGNGGGMIHTGTTAMDGTMSKDSNALEGGEGKGGRAGGGDAGEDTNSATVGAVGVAQGEAATVERDGTSGSAYGYASLRKIKEREPLPEFPRNCVRRTCPLNRGGTSPADRDSSRTRPSSRAFTAPASPGKRPRKQRGHDRDHRSGSSESLRYHGREGQGSGPSPSRAGLSQAFDGDDPLHQDDNIGGEVVTLDEAIADFDDALRDHRSKRRGLGSTIPVPSLASPGRNSTTEPGKRGSRSQEGPGRAMGSPLHDTAATSWFDGEATSWATMDLAKGNGPRETLALDEHRGGMPAGNTSITTRDGGATSTGITQVTSTTQKAGAPPTTLPSGHADVGGFKVELKLKQDPIGDSEVREMTPPGTEHGRTPDYPVSTCPPPGNEEPGTGEGRIIAPEGLQATQSLDPVGSRLASLLESTRVGSPGVNSGTTVPAAEGRGEDAGMPEGVVDAGEPSATDGPLALLPADPSRPPPPFPNTQGLVTRDAHVSTQGGGGGVVAGAKGVSLTQEEQTATTDDPRVTMSENGVEKCSVDPPSAEDQEPTPSGRSEAPSTTLPETTKITADTKTNAGAAVVTAPQIAQAMECPDPIATPEQRTAGDWMQGTEHSTAASNGGPCRLPEPLAVAVAEAELAEKVDRLQFNRLAAEREQNEALNDERASKFERERAARAKGFVEQDRLTLEAEKRRLAELRREADLSRLQRGAEFDENDEVLAVAPRRSAPAETTGATPMPVRGMRPQHFTEQEELPASIKKSLNRPADKVLDEMQRLEARAKAAGGSGMTLEAFERVEQRQQVRQIERLEILHGQTAEEKAVTMLAMAVRLQMFARQRLARMRVERLKYALSTSQEKIAAATAIQSLVRGHLRRISVRRMRRQRLDESILGGRATTIQRVYRGRLGRLVFVEKLRDVRCRVLQKAARGFLGRRVAARKRALLARFAARASSATKLQSAWRGKMARDNYLRARCSWLASREIQRMYRGHLGRRATRRRREWQSAGPGAERLKLGLRMIEDTKVGRARFVAFVKQQGEIAALNRAQEKAEARVSSIHHQLTASESELSVLEREMAELTHERDLISRGITGAAGIPKTGRPRSKNGGGGGGGGGGGDGDDDDHDDHDDFGSGSGDGRGGGRKGRGKKELNKEDAYALEMQLQLKRAEREQRRVQLSAEFASTFADVSDKKRQLDRLSSAVADIEATRQRKSREFGHMQRNLMELLSEQKRELDIVREKGVQLETAAATSAAAAAATAQRARDHEAKAAAMYGQTEELMKFQFMSMSLSYFSSLNMMKQMRDINADTTTAAIAGSADAAAAAAASAAAASIPSLKQTGDLGGDAGRLIFDGLSDRPLSLFILSHTHTPYPTCAFLLVVTKALAVRREKVKATRAEIEEAENSQRHPFPTELCLWTVDDVCRWLDTLQLGEYKQAFREGKVDGSFLGELRESDLMDSIGMEHKLHLKKLLLARQKLTPLSAAEQSMASSVRREDQATSIREEIPDVDTAFSQARHGKKKRLVETLNSGFDINAEDSMGNTLLLVAVQQLQVVSGAQRPRNLPRIRLHADVCS
ncbi:unnamed protein product [Ectocarpus sp. CCAP 1310/34]|nr:unnamed protein product [Ectocarpus sp. CCAP 1310/34]